jgi:hypothetical protein
MIQREYIRAFVVFLWFLPEVYYPEGRDGLPMETHLRHSARLSVPSSENNSPPVLLVHPVLRSCKYIFRLRLRGTLNPNGSSPSFYMNIFFAVFGFFFILADPDSFKKIIISCFVLFLFKILTPVAARVRNHLTFK